MPLTTYVLDTTKPTQCVYCGNWFTHNDPIRDYCTNENCVTQAEAISKAQDDTEYITSI
jgi:hypothetical protein